MEVVNSVMGQQTAAPKLSQSLWIAAALLCAGLPAAGVAADLDARRITVGGFGTIGALYHDEDGLQYRRSTSQPRGAQAGEVDMAVDTIGGVQLNAAWSQKLEAVAQVVTRLDADGSWTPQFTRAFLRYTPNETLALRAGRIGWEIYPRADSRDVGYSQLTIRPSVEVFGIGATELFDGGELTLTHPLGEALANLKLYGGISGGKTVSEDGSINEFDGKIWGGHVDYLRGAWVLRLGTGVFQIDRSADLAALAAGLRQTGAPQAVAIADDLGDRKILFYVAGAAYDEGPVQARLFAARVDGDSLAVPRMTLGLITGGYRFDALTPYAMVSFIDNNDEIRGSGLPDSPQLAPLNAGVLAIQTANRYNQHSLALGLRYDFMPRLALKVQADRVWIRDSRLILDSRDPPGGDARMTVFGVALDFVF